MGSSNIMSQSFLTRDHFAQLSLSLVFLQLSGTVTLMETIEVVKSLIVCGYKFVFQVTSGVLKLNHCC